MKKVFEIFIENGAPKEILYENKPHIGTDILRNVVKNIINKILSMGGKIYYNTCLTDIVIQNNQLKEIFLNGKEKMPCENLILAIGHSARDTFQMLYDKNIQMKAKPFAVGVRVSHPQKMINMAQYGVEENPWLKAASYKLTYTTSKGRGVYSFCMCPGGYVVNASSNDRMLAINGMSNHARDAENANSAIVVAISPDDFGSSPLSGLHFQEKLEKNAYMVGRGKIPIQLLADFRANKTSTKLGNVHPIFKGEYILSNIRDILPDYISNSILEAIPYFDSKIKGFGRDDTILAGVESRTSSPIRIVRDENYMASIKGIYPCGEGAGYAGGITTSAMDGIKVAEAIAHIYTND